MRLRLGPSMRATAPTPLSDASERRVLSNRTSQGLGLMGAEQIERRCVAHHEISDRQASVRITLAFQVAHIAPCICRFGAGRELVTMSISRVRIREAAPVANQVEETRPLKRATTRTHTREGPVRRASASLRMQEILSAVTE